MKLLSGYIKQNNADIALTPYLFLVKIPTYKTYGIGMCFWLHSVYIAVGTKIPKETPLFINHSKN